MVLSVPPPHPAGENTLVYFGPAPRDFSGTSVNYMSPTLNIKPNLALNY